MRREKMEGKRVRRGGKRAKGREAEKRIRREPEEKNQQKSKRTKFLRNFRKTNAKKKKTKRRVFFLSDS